MNEAEFKRDVVKRLKEMFSGCEVFKPDTSYAQAHPDLVILWGPYWASLEFKKSAKASKQPNQDYYIQKLDKMSFAAFIYPENVEEVLHALEQAFTSSRRTRIS